MPETFSFDAAVDLAVVDRSGFVESRHRGAAVVLDADGATLSALGDVDAPILPRSALKPFQALASMKSGVPLRGAQVALACGSHTGSLEHMDVAAGMLAAAGLGEADLQCPAAWPQDEPARTELVRSGRGRSKLAFNCSGKHAAFLWACVENGWDTATYLDPAHPLQQSALDVMEEYTGERAAHVAVDGCGAPAAAFSLRGLAGGGSRLALAPGNKRADARAATVATAMLDYPEIVHGDGRENTVVMQDLGVLAKLGAEGVLLLATDSGVSCALKMLDGNGRAATLVGLTLLVAAGALSARAVEPVLQKVMRPVLGGGTVVGGVRAAAPVLALLG